MGRDLLNHGLHLKAVKDELQDTYGKVFDTLKKEFVQNLTDYIQDNECEDSAESFIRKESFSSGGEYCIKASDWYDESTDRTYSNCMLSLRVTWTRKECAANDELQSRLEYHEKQMKKVKAEIEMKDKKDILNGFKPNVKSVTVAVIGK